MYVPKYFRVDDEMTIENFLRENSFATLITNGTQYPNATHIPLEYDISGDGKKLLCGHISKGNMQCEDFERSPDVLAVFLSPVNHYISSSWYGHPNAPTWNYLSVHVTGKLKVLTGQALWDIVRKLTDRYESHEKNPVSLDTLPKDVQKQMNGIVGFEIEIQRMDCAFKLSQNRNVEDFENILRELRMINSATSKLMADVMESMRR